MFNKKSFMRKVRYYIRLARNKLPKSRKRKLSLNRDKKILKKIRSLAPVRAKRISL